MPFVHWVSLLAVPVTFGGFLLLLKTLEDIQTEHRSRAWRRHSASTAERAQGQQPSVARGHLFRPWVAPGIEAILNGDRHDDLVQRVFDDPVVARAFSAMQEIQRREESAHELESDEDSSVTVFYDAEEEAF